MNQSFTILFFGFVVVFGVFLVIGAIWLEKIMRVAIATHQIVNSQRSAMQTAIWLLSQRIATENPNDRMAQDAAERAKQELEMLDKPRRVAI